MKKLTAVKWKFNEDTNTFTGKEYTVDFCPSTGVSKIHSIYAVQKGIDFKIDITMSDVDDLNADAFIETLIDWDEVYANEPVKSTRSDRYFEQAKKIARFHAQSYRS